jgi:hypothetical protein
VGDRRLSAVLAAQNVPICRHYSRRRPESNRCKRLCRPLRSHSATSPKHRKGIGATMAIRGDGLRQAVGPSPSLSSCRCRLARAAAVMKILRTR